MNNRPQTLFLGNGFNRLHSDEFNWNEVLKSASDSTIQKIADGVPYTHVYEKLYLSKICSYETDIKDKIGEKQLKAEIAERLESLMVTDFGNRKYPREYEDFFDNGYCPFQNVLTTNYDYGFDNILSSIGYLLIDKNTQEDVYSLMRRLTYRKNDSVVNVWHIHGESKGKNNSSQSIMLGYDHYCATLSRIETYVKRGKIGTKVIHDNQNRSNKYHILPCLINDEMYQWNVNDIETWIDTFFFTDIHIIGFGMDFSELDIWWLLNKRMRYMTDKSSVNYIKMNSQQNSVYYYGQTNDSIIDALQTYGVKCRNIKIKDNKNKEEWKKSYKEHIGSIKNTIHNNLSIF